MTVVNDFIELRDDQKNSLAAIIRSANKMHDLFLQSGMVQVDSNDYLGQSLTYSDVGGVGMTKITKQNQSYTEALVGYKVYKHPNMNIYVRVMAYDVNNPDLNFSYLRYKYQVSTELKSGTFEPSKTTGILQSKMPITGNGGHSSILANGTKSITLSCGSDYFWISRDGGFQSMQEGNRWRLPVFIDEVSFGFFASEQDPNVICVVTMQEIGSVGNSGVAGQAMSTYLKTGCLGYILINNGSITVLDNGALGNVPNARVTSTTAGTRVTRASIIANGIHHYFNFGYIPYNSAASFSVLNINLTGVEQPYQALPYYGLAEGSPSMADGMAHSILIMPLSN